MSLVHWYGAVKYLGRARLVVFGLTLLTLSVAAIVTGCGSSTLPHIDTKGVAGIEVETDDVLGYEDAQEHVDAIVSAYNDASPDSFDFDTTPQYSVRLLLADGRRVSFMFSEVYPPDCLVVSWSGEDDTGSRFVEVRAPGLKNAAVGLLREHGYSEPPSGLDLTMAELVGLVTHKVYWLGKDFEGRSLVESSVSGTGVVTLQYGEDPRGPFEPGTSPVVSVYEYAPTEIDPEVLANLEAQLTNPREVRGIRGMYDLCDAAFNGMPILRVVMGDVVIHVVDVWEGDVELMISAADTLVEASDR